MGKCAVPGKDDAIATCTVGLRDNIATPEKDGILPPIALLVTVYNRQDKLERALASVEPEHDLLDVVIVDDGSSPPVNLPHLPTLCVHLIRCPANRGTAAAANEGLKYIFDAGYEFVARLDSDDVVIGPRFARQLAFLQARPDVGVVGTRYELVRTDGSSAGLGCVPLEDKRIRRGMRWGIMLKHTTLMMRTSAVREAGLYDERYLVSEDFELLWRLLGVTRAANLPDFLVRYEVGGSDSLSTSQRRIQAINGLKVKLRHFDPWDSCSYLGLLSSLLHVTNTIRYVMPLKAVILRLTVGRG